MKMVARKTERERTKGRKPERQRIISRGAEAILLKTSKTKVLKKRAKKSYRFPTLDEKIRRTRTKRESRILEKAQKLIPVPKVKKHSDTKKEIELQYISGKRLSDYLEKLKNRAFVCRQIGMNIARLHDSGIIHGDLTTSNMIYKEKEKKVYFIDFGLSFHSSRQEDKSVDLHLIRQALETRHPGISGHAFKEILEGYRHSKNSQKIINRLKKVEKRGRYKSQY